MTPRALDPFAHVWLCDFEYRQPEGCQPEVHCMVARERRTGETIRAWGDDLARMTQPPFAIGPEAVFVAFYASAEMNCFLALGWPLPARYPGFVCRVSLPHQRSGGPLWQRHLGCLGLSWDRWHRCGRKRIHAGIGNARRTIHVR